MAPLNDDALDISFCTENPANGQHGYISRWLYPRLVFILERACGGTSNSQMRKCLVSLQLSSMHLACLRVDLDVFKWITSQQIQCLIQPETGFSWKKRTHAGLISVVVTKWGSCNAVWESNPQRTGFSVYKGCF